MFNVGFIVFMWEYYTTVTERNYYTNYYTTVTLYVIRNILQLHVIYVLLINYYNDTNCNVHMNVRLSAGAPPAKVPKKTYDLNTQADAFLNRYAGSPFPEAVDANEKELAEVSGWERERGDTTTTITTILVYITMYYYHCFLTYTATTTTTTLRCPRERPPSALAQTSPSSLPTPPQSWPPVRPYPQS